MNIIDLLKPRAGLRVFVSAGAAGIGAAIAEAFLQAQAKVYICDVNATAVADARARAPDLHAGIADVTEGRLHDPQVRFFVRSNPGHERGDELCCLAPLGRANFTRAAYRVIGPEPALLRSTPMS